MAHGYLSVQDTRGDKDYLRNIGDILKLLLDRGEENGAPPDKGGALVLQKKEILQKYIKNQILRMIEVDH